jgi:hypothetical protein
MNQDDLHDRRNDIRLGLMHETAVYAGIAAAMMLYFGFGRPFDIASGSQLYINSVFATNWLLRIGGIALAATALFCWIGLQWSLLADAIVSALIGVGLVVIGGIWISDSDMEGFLFLIFGAMFLNAARTSWNGSAATPRAPFPVVPVAEREASVDRPIDEAVRQSARERLLQTKANLRSPASPPPVAIEVPEILDEPPQAHTPQPSNIPAPSVSTVPAAPSAPPAQREPAAAPTPELPEEGFLAELGRTHRDERK